MNPRRFTENVSSLRILLNIAKCVVISADLSCALDTFRPILAGKCEKTSILCHALDRTPLNVFYPLTGA